MSGFLSLWTGIPIPEQAEGTVKEHYSDPEKFKSVSGLSIRPNIAKAWYIASKKTIIETMHIIHAKLIMKLLQLPGMNF